MRVKAITDHFDGTYRKAGDEFEIEGKKLHEHIVRADKPKPPEVESLATGEPKQDPAGGEDTAPQE